MHRIYNRWRGSLNWDKAAMAVSGLCVVHCIATVVFIAILSSFGAFLLDPIFHEVGITLAIAIGLYALGKGYRDHGEALPAMIGGVGLLIMAGAMMLDHGVKEAFFTMLGVSILAFGHHRNRRALCAD